MSAPTTSPTRVITAGAFLSEAKLVAVSIVPMITAFFSLLGSGCIIYMIRREKKKPTYKRLMLALSSFDLLNSANLMLGPIPFLKETKQFMAKGNTQTCTMSGFLFQIGMSVLYYNVSLMIFYVLTIRYGMRESFMKGWIELWFHIISVLKPLVEAFVGLGLRVFNPIAYSGCYIAPYPPFCGSADFACTRGQAADVLFLVFFIIPVLFMMFIFLISVGLVYLTAVQQEKRASSLTDSVRERRKTIATQCWMYCFCWLNAFIWMAIPGMFGLWSKDLTKHRKYIYPMILTGQFFYPSQGLFNFVIFLRPRYLRLRRNYPQNSRWWAFSTAIHGTDRETVNASQQRWAFLQRRRRRNDDADAKASFSDASATSTRIKSMRKDSATAQSPTMEEATIGREGDEEETSICRGGDNETT